MKNIERIDDSTVKIDGVVFVKQVELPSVPDVEYEFKDREWVIYEGNNYPIELPVGSIGRYKMDNSMPTHAWVKEHNGTGYFLAGVCVVKSDLRPATDKEVEAHLIAEAEKRGFKDGAKYQWAGLEIRTVEYPLEYENKRLSDANGYIIYDGRWAEIIKAEFPQTREALKKLLNDFWYRLPDDEEVDGLNIDK